MPGLGSHVTFPLYFQPFDGFIVAFMADEAQ